MISRKLEKTEHIYVTIFTVEISQRPKAHAVSKHAP